MSEYSDFDTAVEIMAYKISDCVKKLETDNSFKEELEKLKNERDKMYSGDKKTINKILNIYGQEIKNIYKNI